MPAGAVVTTAGADRHALYKGRVTASIILTCIIAASGGLLFGYDIGVTGGIISHEDFKHKFFPSTAEPHQESQYCKYDNHELQLFTSSLFLAGLVAALVGSKYASVLGRRPMMLMAGIFFLLGTILLTAAVHISMLIIGRVILGLGVGLANQSVPVYLSEVAPYNLRGAMNILFQMAVTIGILAAQLINYGTQYLHPWGWRLSHGLAAVPAVLLTVGSLFLPETPNSLIERGKLEEGRKVLQRIRGVDDVEVEYDDICQAARVVEMQKHSQFAIFKKRYWPQLISVILIPAFQQLTGINSIMFYAPQLFQSLGSSSAMSLLQTVIIGIVNVLATIVAILYVDKFGRRALFLQGGVQMFIAEVVVGSILATQFADGQLSDGLAVVIIVMICIFVAGFAWSWGPLAWLVPTEIQPLETRSTGQAINVAVNFLVTFIIGQFFLSMLCSMEFGIFFFFAGWVVLMTIYIFFFLPETKNVPIEEVVNVSFRRHWFWGRLVGNGPTDATGPPYKITAENEMMPAATRDVENNRTA